MKKKVAVFFGGKSSEHDISIITAVQAMKELDKEKYVVFPIYINKQNEWFYSEDFKDIKNFVSMNEKKYQKVVFQPALKKILIQKRKKFIDFVKIDFALLCCHGFYGEDGCLQGSLEMCDIPYSSPCQISSGLCMDKILMKSIFLANSINTTKFVWFNRYEFENEVEKVVANIEQKIGYPCIVKPSRLGSSIGITFCKNRDELKNACELAITFDNRVIVEEGLENFREINCGVLGNSFSCETSVLEEPKLNKEILNFDDKYLSSDNFKRKIDVKLPKKVENEIKTISKRVFKEFCCKGVIRIDFMYDETNKKIYINELNTIPGSLSFYLWKDRSYSKLLEDIINYNLKEYDEKNKTKFTFDSNAIINFSSSKSQKLGKTKFKS